MKKSLIYYRIFGCLIVNILFCASATSQENNTFEFGLSLRPHLSHFQISGTLANSSNDANGAYGVVAIYALSNSWRLGFEISYNSFYHRLKKDEISGKYATVDLEGDDFEFNYRAKNVREKLILQQVQFPIFVQYETSGVTKFYARGGVQLNLPISLSSEFDVPELRTSGYYPAWDVELSGPRFMGFGKFNNLRTERVDRDKLNLGYGIYAEAGVKQIIDRSQSIYFGMFFNYGLNNINSEQSLHQLVEYNTSSPTDFIWNSFTESQYSEQTSFISSMRLIQYGFTIQYVFGNY